MKRQMKFYLIVLCAVVLFDVVGSFASKALKFDYTHLVWVSWLLYAGYFGFVYSRLPGALLAGLIAGLADATIGWGVSSAIGPYTSIKQPSFTIPLIAVVVVYVSMQAAFFGLIGGLFRWLLTSVRKRP